MPNSSSPQRSIGSSTPFRSCRIKRLSGATRNCDQIAVAATGRPANQSNEANVLRRDFFVAFASFVGKLRPVLRDGSVAVSQQQQDFGPLDSAGD